MKKFETPWLVVWY